MAVVTPTPKAQFLMLDGTPLVGGKVYSYAAGTTTPQVTYTDSTGATPNENPVILDSRGEANIWLGSSSYKFRLTDENDVEIWTVDNVAPPTTAVSPVLTGNVTISTESISPALKITQTGTGNALVVQDSADPDATPFVITAEGKVGLGTPSPINDLDCAGTIGADSIVGYTSTTSLAIAGIPIVTSSIGGDYLRIASKTTVASTTGTSIAFTAIPTWARRVTVMFAGVSTDSTSPILVRVGTAAGIVSTGYIGTSARIATGSTAVDTSTAGFIINSTAAADTVSGTMTINLLDPTNFFYIADHTFKAGTTAVMCGGGRVTATNLLTQLSITTVSGTANFDAGSINVLYE
jgi:hypothetical protein